MREPPLEYGKVLRFDRVDHELTGGRAEMHRREPPAAVELDEVLDGQAEVQRVPGELLLERPVHRLVTQP